MKKDYTELTVAEHYNMEKERLKVYHVSVPTVYVQRSEVFLLLLNACFTFCSFFSPEKDLS